MTQPQREKTNLLTYAPNEDSNQSVRILGIKNACSEDSDQTANARANLNLRWALILAGTFSDIVAHVIILSFNNLLKTAESMTSLFGCLSRLSLLFANIKGLGCL